MVLHEPGVCADHKSLRIHRMSMSSMSSIPTLCLPSHEGVPSGECRPRGPIGPQCTQSKSSGDSYIDRFGTIDEWKALYENDDWSPRELTPTEMQRHHFNAMFATLHRIRSHLPHGENMVVLADTVRRALQWFASLWTKAYRRVKVIRYAKRRLEQFYRESKARRTVQLDAMLQTPEPYHGGILRCVHVVHKVCTGPYPR